MTLEYLLDDTFKRGVGISRAFALKTDRYKQLKASLRPQPYVKPNELAEMIYLGERLADRAFLNLPKYLREAAYLWDTMDEAEHESVLVALMLELRSTRWNAYTSGERIGTENQYEALPHQTKSWRRGPYRPNCLGVSQVLIGFARAAQIDHFMVDVLQGRDIHSLHQGYLAMTELEKSIAPYTFNQELRKLHRIIKRFRRGQLADILKIGDRQAHHALMAYIDGEWVLIDPYFNTLHTQKFKGKALTRGHAVLQRKPKHHYVMSSDAFRIRMNMALEAVAMTEKLLDKEKLDNTFAELSELAACLTVSELRNGTADTALVQARYALYVSEALNIGSNKMLKNENTKLSMDRVDFILNRPNRSLFLRKRFYRRILARVVREVVRYVADLESGVWGNHGLMELSHPTLHLAVMTLNHNAHLQGVPSGDLIRFDTSQFVLRDVATEILQGNCKLHQRVLRSRLHKLEKLPPQMVLPELR